VNNCIRNPPQKPALESTKKKEEKWYEKGTVLPKKNKYNNSVRALGH
jgi:hypothetical protein